MLPRGIVALLSCAVGGFFGRCLFDHKIWLYNLAFSSDSSRLSLSCSLPVTLNSWVDESNVVFIVQVGSDLLGDLNESSEGKLV